MRIEIPNPLTMNDWNIVAFLKVIVVLQVVLWGVIVLDSTPLEIPILRALFAFVYLMFVPGITLLRVLRNDAFFLFPDADSNPLSAGTNLRT